MKNKYLALTAFLSTIFLLLFVAHSLISFSDWQSFNEYSALPKTSLHAWITVDLVIYSIFAIFVPAVFLQSRYGNLIATLVPAFASGILFIGIEHVGLGIFGDNESLIFSALVGVWIIATLFGLLLWPISEDE